MPAKKKQETVGARNDLLLSCLLGALATLGAISCSHNSENPDAATPANMTAGSPNTAPDNTGATSATGGSSNGTMSGSGTGGTPTQ